MGGLEVIALFSGPVAWVGLWDLGPTPLGGAPSPAPQLTPGLVPGLLSRTR